MAQVTFPNKTFTSSLNEFCVCLCRLRQVQPILKRVLMAQCFAVNAGGFEPLIERYAKLQQLDPALVKAVIAVESSIQPNVVSAKGAIGLMQIIPETGERYGVAGDSTRCVDQKLRDPATNLRVGIAWCRCAIAAWATLSGSGILADS